MLKTNYHTHSTFCDGHNSAEEMVREAITRGFDSLGFSSHSMYPFSSDWHLPSREHSTYAAEIRRLAKKYPEINIGLGFEADFIDGVCAPIMDRFKEFKPDYLIGSVHYVPGKSGFIEADGANADVIRGIDSYFAGDVKEAVCTYFYLERLMLQKGDFAILGHADLIRKQNSKKNSRPLFSEQEEWYRREIKCLAEEIKKADVCVEINTGGMSRGWMESPYPSLELLEKLQNNNVRITFSSDAHQKEHLDFGMEAALKLAKKAGYREAASFNSDFSDFVCQPLPDN